MTKLLKTIPVILILSHIAAFSQTNELHRQGETPPIVPAWAFVPWVWEDSINTQQAVFRLVDGYQKRNIPVGAVIIDSPWSTAYNNFEWDTDRYPDPQAMIDELHEKGVRIVMWLTGFINSESTDVPIQKSGDYEYVKEQNYVVDDGRETSWWKGKGVHIDFTNPAAVKWFQGRLDKILDMQIDGFKIDGGIGALDVYEVQTSLGKMRMEQFGKYYYDSVAAYGMSRNPDFVNSARGYSYQSGTISGTKYLQTTFQGDFAGHWLGLKHQIDNTYKTARLGFGAPGFEVGGFMEEASSKPQFVRYAQFGSLCPVMDNGGANGAFSFHLPWFHGEDVANIYQYYATLHTELAPYLFSASVDAHFTGKSILHNTSFTFESHQLGEWFFIKAITSDNNTIDLQLPANGNWIDYWTGKKYRAGSFLQGMKYELDKFPIFIKSGAIIPMNVVNDITGFGNAGSEGKQTILIFPEGMSEFMYHKPLGQGIEYEDIIITIDAGASTIHIESERDEDYIFLVRLDKQGATEDDSDSLLSLPSGKFRKIVRSGSTFTISYK